MKNIDWYHSLKQPPLSPPDWIFAPVWSVLYILMALSLIIFLKDGNGSLKRKTLPLLLFILQLILNFSWTPLFFSFQKIGVALIVCFLLWLSILGVIKTFFSYSRISAILLLPYLLWTTFALYLNLELWLLNSK